MDTGRINTVGKPEWKDMLYYVADLRLRSIHPAMPPFPQPWENIGTGYCYGPAFGHWDIVHAILDALPLNPEHARQQIENNFAAQHEDGFLPGSIWLRDGEMTWNKEVGHPPVWPFAVQAYCDVCSADILPLAYATLIRQIGWFERNRKAEGKGFFYTDILTQQWESGVDEGIRFLDTRLGRFACVDATSHVFAMYRYAQKWGEELGKNASEYKEKADALQRFIQDVLFVKETSFFHDIWAVKEPELRCFAFEGMWPLVVGAATPEQAHAVIEENLLNPQRFFTAHPLATVSVDDPRFELRMWRGPAWNSMTYWAARGCMNYGAFSSAKVLLERALDDSAKQFERTGTIWEFYHPHGGNPEDLQRKPHTEFNAPCRDYLGHNPLLAMALLYDKANKQRLEPNIEQGHF